MSSLTPLSPPVAQAQPFTPAEMEAIKAQFPVLQRQVYGKPLVYLDSGATTQKPQCVIDAITQFYAHDYGTVRRGVYALAEGSTVAFDKVREQVASFINAPSADTCVFTRGCTEAINLVAHCWGNTFLKAGDAIVISGMEHHANLVPWQQVAQQTGASLEVVPVTPEGELDLEAYDALLAKGNVKLVALIHVSNVLGTINPAQALCQKAHAAGALVLLDGAQSVPHIPVDVQALDCDFMTFSAHKLYGPTGVGVLYAKAQHLADMPPYQFGGDMIDVVTLERTTFADAPKKFEAGTPPIAQVIGLGAALSFMQNLGMARLAATEEALLAYATPRLLQDVPGLTIYGTAPHKCGLVSFSLASAHPLDIGTLLDHEGIALRTGHHCAQPLMRQLQVSATARASFGVYTTYADVDALVAGLQKVHKLCA
jgi:cysteine desulfurase/selenocysteine lyase